MEKICLVFVIIFQKVLNLYFSQWRIKWSNLGNGVAPSLTPQCSSYWKGTRLRSPTLLFIYVREKTIKVCKLLDYTWIIFRIVLSTWYPYLIRNDDKKACSLLHPNLNARCRRSVGYGGVSLIRILQLYFYLILKSPPTHNKGYVCVWALLVLCKCVITPLRKIKMDL